MYMLRAFNSISIADYDQDVREYFRQLFLENGIVPRTVGIDVQPVNYQQTPQLARTEIQIADCVIAVLTHRYLANGWKSSEWTVEEPAMGYYGKKPVYVFYEQGIDVKGMLQTTGKYLIEFDRYRLWEQVEYKRLSYWIEQIRLDVEQQPRQNNGWEPGKILTTALACFTAGGVLGWYLRSKR